MRAELRIEKNLSLNASLYFYPQQLWADWTQLNIVQDYNLVLSSMFLLN